MRISCSELTDFNPSGRSELWNSFFFFLLVCADAFWRVESASTVYLFGDSSFAKNHLNWSWNKRILCYHMKLSQYFSHVHLKNGLISGCYWIKQRMTAGICVYPPLHITPRLTFAEGWDPAVLPFLICISGTTDQYVLTRTLQEFIILRWRLHGHGEPSSHPDDLQIIKKKID